MGAIGGVDGIELDATAATAPDTKAPVATASGLCARVFNLDSRDLVLISQIFCAGFLNRGGSSSVFLSNESLAICIAYSGEICPEETWDSK